MPDNKTTDHIGSFNFKVEIDGVSTAVVARVDGLDERAAFSGQAGLSGKVTLHGLTPLDRTGAERLQSWHKASQKGARAQKRVAILKYDDFGRKVQHSFFEAWPSKWKGYSLDGKGDDAASSASEWKVSEMDGKSNSSGDSASRWKMASMDGKGNVSKVTAHGWDYHAKKAIIGEVELNYTGLRLK